MSASYGPKTVYSVDKDYELTVWSNGTIEERSYLGPVVVYRQGGTREVRYQHLDRLGSLDAVTGDDAAAKELLADAHGYDPWGKPRAREWTQTTDAPLKARLHPNGDLPSLPNPSVPGETPPAHLGATTDRGFTGHEHLDVHYLIHMNGRMYDYRLARFLSVDPIISNPMNPQSVNPYSYIGNNPMSGVDPTGYDPCSPTQGGQQPGACKMPDTPTSRNDMVVARQSGSIAGRAGDNTTIGGVDQDALGYHEPAGNGAKGQQSQQPNSNTVDHQNPSQTAQGTQSETATSKPKSFRPQFCDCSASCALELDTARVLNGDITQEQARQNAEARALGAAVGVAVVAAVAVAPEVLAAAGPIVARAPTFWEQVKSFFQRLLGSGVSPCPGPEAGRQVINGIEYTQHALERMAPAAFGGRGVPPSVVENVIRVG